MRRLLVCLAVVGSMAVCAPRADAKMAALYASGQGGLQNTGDPGLQAGFEVGARVLIFDGYVDYMAADSGRTISRGIIGLRGALSVGPLRFVLRGGAGAIRIDNEAVMRPAGDVVVTRTGGVARAGAAIEAKVAPLIWLGLGVDGEEYGFLNNVAGLGTHSSDVLGTLKLTFELGI